MSGAVNAFAKVAAERTARRDRAKVALLRRTRMSGRLAASWRCRLCGSRVEVTLRVDPNFKEIGSTGKCLTPGCITWED